MVDEKLPAPHIRVFANVIVTQPYAWRRSPWRYRPPGSVLFFFAPWRPAFARSLVDFVFAISFLDSDTNSASLALTRCFISRSSPVSGMPSPPQPCRFWCGRFLCNHEEAVLLGSHQNTNSHKLPAFESCDALAVGRNDVHAVKAVRSDYLAEVKEILS